MAPSFSALRTSPTSGMIGPDELPGAVPLPPLPLVGRARPMSLLLQLLELSGAERVAVVTGAGGVGKSRLLDRVEEEAGWRGWQLARGRAFPVEQGLPYGIFGDALVPLIDAMGVDRLRVLARGSERDFGVLFPGLVDGPLPTERDSDEFVSRLFWNFAAFLTAMGRERPLLLTLDDVHWADPASLRLLHFLVRHTGPEVRYLFSYSDADRHASPNWIEAERALLGLRETRIVRLGQLGHEEVLQLVCRAFEVDPAVVASFAERLWDWTRGNPWLIRETLAMLVQRGELHCRDGMWLGWSTPLGDLPPSIREAIRRRIDALPRNARRLLDRLAILGGRAGPALMDRIVDLDDEVRFASLEELVRWGLVSESKGEPGAPTYGVRHPIVRRTVADEMSAARAARLHGRIGRALEALAAADGGSTHDIGRHLARSDDPDDRQRAVRHLASAGRDALARYAHRQAEEDLGHALRLHDHLTISPGEGRATPLDPTERAELLEQLARAHRGSGRFAEARRLWREALDATPETDPAARVARLTELGSTLVRMGRANEALSILDEAVRAVEPTGDGLALARVRLSLGSAHQELGNADEARAEISAALDLSRDDDALRAEAHRALGMLHIWIGPREEAESNLTRGLRLAESLGNPELRFDCALGLALLNGSTGRRDEALNQLELAARIADSLNSPVLRLRVDELRLERAYSEGRWDAAVAIGEQAIAVSRELGERPLLPRLLVWTAAIHLGRGDESRARAFVDEACELAGMGTDRPSDIHAIVPAYIGLAHFHLVTGEWESAVQVAERGLAIAEGTGYVLWTLHRLLPILAEAYLWLEDTAAVEQVARRLRAHSARMEYPLGALFADACDAMIVWKRGDAELGAELMRRVADALEAAPMVPLAVRIRRQLAGRLAEIGARDASVRELKRVQDDLLRLGLERELEKTRIQFREVGARPPSRASAPSEPLTDRELEIARLVATGRSNKAVGRELGISARTVSTHLTKIYRKLGVRDRGELERTLSG